MRMRKSRRNFLKTTAASGIGFWVAGGVQAQESKSPNEKIRFACIGIGGKGASDSADAGKAGDVVAVCDVDDKTLGTADKRFPQAKKYSDFRKLFEEMGKDIDAVTVSTPDHCHAAAAAMAMHMGKHCFCQKPLTHTIYEARFLGDLAREKKLATQMGNQGTSTDSLRKTAAVVKSGVLGKVSEVHIWTNRPIWPQGGERPEEAPVPAYLHWDLWIGPAPMRPFGRGYHPFAWRGYWDFGTGALGDMACHTMNMPFMALNLRDPISVAAKCSGHNKDSYPKWSVIEYEFAALGDRPAVKVVWYDGGKKPGRELLGKDFDQLDAKGKKRELAASGCMILGDKANLYAPGDYCDMPQLFGGPSIPEVTFEKSPGHFQEFALGIKGGPQPKSNFPDYAGPLSEMMLLGNLAVWSADKGEGKKIQWDAKNLKTLNAPEVEHIVRVPYRAGYTL